MPSDQTTVNGAVPVSAALIVTPAEPAQNVPPPLTTAEGRVPTLTVALPLAVPVHDAEEMRVMVYVVFADGETFRVKLPFAP